MKLTKKKVSLAVLQAVSAGMLAGMAAPSLAQTSAPQIPAAGLPAQPTREVINVTGTRIIQPNLEAISPITSISAQDIRVSSPVSTENLLNNMPQVFAEAGNQQTNGANGTATVNLRGFGSDRT